MGFCLVQEESSSSPLSLRSLSDLSLALSSNATTLNHHIILRGSQGIQIWKQRTELGGSVAIADMAHEPLGF